MTGILVLNTLIGIPLLIAVVWQPWALRDYTTRRGGAYREGQLRPDRHRLAREGAETQRRDRVAV